MTPDGVFVTQSGSPILMRDELVPVVEKLGKLFKFVRVYLAFIPSYPGTLWSFTMATNGRDPLTVSRSEIAERLNGFQMFRKYYTPEVHQACFVLPQFLDDSINRGHKLGIFES